jgi:2'-5' RNA ligase
VAQVIGEVRSALGRDGEAVRWVREDGLHLTLRFLGSTPEPMVAGVGRAMALVASGGFPAPLAVGRGGAFPSPKRPRVLWLGVVQGADRLRVRAEDLDAQLVAVGWPAEDRPFRPHLTLARVAEGAGAAAAGATAARLLMDRAEPFSAEWTADRLTLFESRLSRGPARYEVVAEAILGR